MSIRWSVFWVLAAVLLTPACGRVTGSDGALKLPPGDVAAGKAAFQELGCVQCHSVAGVDGLPAPTGSIKMELGGRTHHVRNQGQLVTAIIHPTHSISGRAPAETRRAGATPMTSLNDSMTVTEMINLVSFLDSRYRKQTFYNPAPF
ncbi:MAG: cytochrome c [Gemmatimonadetes bacterium]|nr:cytochrome c [Gemmatimonadota bacterium]